jgi:hypothetical protein
MGDKERNSKGNGEKRGQIKIKRPLQGQNYHMMT